MMISDWRDYALCVGADPETFYPVATRGPIFDDAVAKASGICGACPVRRECLTFALDHDLEFGIFAGTTPEQRRRMLPMPVAPAPTPTHAPMTYGTTVPWSARPRGRCSHCETRYPLRVDGAVIEHARSGGYCKGSRLAPLVEETVDA